MAKKPEKPGEPKKLDGRFLGTAEKTEADAWRPLFQTLHVRACPSCNGIGSMTCGLCDGHGAVRVAHEVLPTVELAEIEEKLDDGTKRRRRAWRKVPDDTKKPAASS